jgi:putative transposase
MTVDWRRRIVEPDHAALSIVRQCELLSISRSGFYYEPSGESAETLALMRLIDEAYLRFPYYGSRQIARHLHAIFRQGWCKHRRDGPPVTDASHPPRGALGNPGRWPS